jgi:hypothetical protein
MNSMSIAIHCSMLMNGGRHIVPALKHTVLPNGGVIRMMSGKDTDESVIWGSSFDVVMNDESQSAAVSVACTSMHAQRTINTAIAEEISFTTVFYVTHEGLAEIRAGLSSLAVQARRALLLIDGFRSAADLSLRLRGGDAEKILRDLEARKLIARLAGVDGNAVAAISAEKKLSPERLEKIKKKIVRDLRARLGRPADYVLNDVLRTIASCENAIDLRVALRNAGDVLVIELGEAGVIGHVRAIGRNVMELLAESE